MKYVDISFFAFRLIVPWVVENFIYWFDADKLISLIAMQLVVNISINILYFFYFL